MLKVERKQGRAAKLSFIFVAIIVLLVIFSLSVKLILLLKKSQFDGQHRFTIEIIGKKNQVISFCPKLNSISIVNITSLDGGKASSLLEVPINAYIRVSSPSFNKNNISSLFFKMLFRSRLKADNVNKIDILKIALFSSSVAAGHIKIVSVSGNDDYKTIQSAISGLFVYPSIQEEGDTIQVVNGTGVSGLAARLSEFISNMGGDVILVTNSANNVTSSKIVYSGKNDYTVAELSKILGFSKNKVEGDGIANVTLTIGGNSLTNLTF